ncbi:MAG TPA: amidohydrolase family protein [Stenotrophomonas sp.]|jgi:L-fuconolactonase
MLIDAHQHYWRYDPKTYGWIGPGMEVLAQDWLPAQFEPVRQANGIDATIAVQARGNEDDTAFLMQLARQARWIAGIVGWVDLRADGVSDRLAHWRAHGPLVGIRHQVQDEPNPSACLADAAFDRGVAAVQRARLVYEVLVRHEHLEAATVFCARHDDHALVLDHLGKPDIGGTGDTFERWQRQIRALAAMPHVSVKISGLVTEAPRDPDGRLALDGIGRHLDAALECFGPRRVLFGSDWPVSQLATDYPHVLALAQDWAQSRGLSVPERECLFGGNAIDIYGDALRLP